MAGTLWRSAPGVKHLYLHVKTGEYGVRGPRVNGKSPKPVGLGVFTEIEAIESMGAAMKTTRIQIAKPVPDTTMAQHWAAVVAYQDSLVCSPKDKWGDSTREQHTRHWRLRIEPFLGELLVREVEELDCQAVLDAMIEGGKMVKKEGQLVREDLSGSQIAQCYMTMSMLFRFAKRGRFGKLISESPLADIEQPEKSPAKQLTHEDILQVEDITALLRVAPKREAGLFALADLTGGRTSELLGLQLRHHDPKAGPSGTLEFASQLRRRKLNDTRDPLIPLKGKKDIAGSEARVLKLSPAANRLLIELRLAMETSPDTFFFATRSGQPLSQRNVARTLEVAAEKAGIERPCTMHSFRHHYASRMFAAGATIEEVQRDLGHSSREVTIKHYVRLIPTQAADDRAALLHAAAGLA